MIALTVDAPPRVRLASAGDGRRPPRGGSMDPSGTWFWIWDYRHFEHSWRQIADRLAQLGARGVLVKAWDGEWRWTRQWSPEVVAIFRDRGLGVAPWGYTVGDWRGPSPDVPHGDRHDSTIDLDTAAAAWAVEQGGDFLVINPEIEWARQPDPAGHAHRYFDLLRERIGDTRVYAAPVPYDTGHWQGNPLDAIADRADGTMPQCYAFMWGVAGTLDWLIRMAAGRGRGKPVYPIIDLANNAGDVAPAAYLRAATTAARLAGCDGLSYWHYPLIDARQAPALADAGRQLVSAYRPAAADPDAALNAALARLDALGLRYLLGLSIGNGTADLSRWGGPAEVRWHRCEKGALWTADGHHVDAFHPGQLDELLADGGARRDP